MGPYAQTSLLTKVIYSGDNIDAFETFASARKLNGRATRKRNIAGGKTVGSTRFELGQGYVASKLAAEQFKTVHRTNAVYSLPAAACGPKGVFVQPLHHYISGSSVAPRVADSKEDDMVEDDFALCTFEPTTAPAAGVEPDSGGLLMFQIVSPNPSKHQNLERPASAGGKISDSALAVQLICHSEHIAGGLVLNTGRVDSAEVAVLDYLGASVDTLRPSLLGHATSDTLMYCLDGHEYDEQVGALLELFMQAGAVGMPTSIPFVPPPAFGRQLYLLHQRNVVDILRIPGLDGVDTSTWVLTRQGASRVKATFSVEMGSPILQIRDLPIKELTTFEKFMKLADAGWPVQTISADPFTFSTSLRQTLVPFRWYLGPSCLVENPSNDRCSGRLILITVVGPNGNRVRAHENPTTADPCQCL